MPEVQCMGFKVIGDDIIDSHLLTSGISKELSGQSETADVSDEEFQFHTKIGPQDLVKSHGSTDSIGQKVTS